MANNKKEEIFEPGNTEQIIKQDNLDQEKYSTNEMMSILREYREHAWVNGLIRYDLEEWMVKRFNLNRSEHFSKKKETQDNKDVPGLLGHYGVSSDPLINNKHREANLLIDEYNSTVYKYKTIEKQNLYQKEMLYKIRLLINK